jgi:hypothetical protein
MVVPTNNRSDADPQPAALAPTQILETRPLAQSAADRVAASPLQTAVEAGLPTTTHEQAATREQPVAREPVATREQGPPSSQRARHQRFGDERDFTRAAGSRRRPRNLDKTDPWAE